jgi:hypothetical protein
VENINADDINMLDGNIQKSQVLLEFSREVGLEANAEKSKYTFVSCNQNVRKNDNSRFDNNKSFENVTKFKYLVKKVENRNCIH